MAAGPRVETYMKTSAYTGQNRTSAPELGIIILSDPGAVCLSLSPHSSARRHLFLVEEVPTIISEKA